MSNELVTKSCEITLKNKNFREDFIQLTRNELGPITERTELTKNQIMNLLETASLFALSKDKQYHKLAFKISVYLLNQFKNEYEHLPLAVEIIMSRLGNIPTIRSMIANDHGDDYFSYFQNLEEEMNYSSLSTFLKFPEIIVKQITNKKKVTEDFSLTFTDFQANIYSLLKEKKKCHFFSPYFYW